MTKVDEIYSELRKGVSLTMIRKNPSFRSQTRSRKPHSYSARVKYTAILLIPASLLITILSHELVYIFYGQSYNLAPSFLSLYILTFLYSGLGSMVLGHLLNGIGFGVAG
ncbi:MAG: hypothetical protein V1850_00015 [Candidatus Bathyarchaeota archaeon]